MNYLLQDELKLSSVQEKHKHHLRVVPEAAHMISDLLAYLVVVCHCDGERGQVKGHLIKLRWQWVTQVFQPVKGLQSTKHTEHTILFFKLAGDSQEQWKIVHDRSGDRHMH